MEKSAAFNVGFRDGIEKIALSPETVSRAAMERVRRAGVSTAAAENAVASSADQGLKRLVVNTARRDSDKAKRFLDRSQSWSHGARQRAVNAVARRRVSMLKGLGVGLLAAGAAGAGYKALKDRQ